MSAFVAKLLACKNWPDGVTLDDGATLIKAKTVTRMQLLELKFLSLTDHHRLRKKGVVESKTWDFVKIFVSRNLC